MVQTSILLLIVMELNGTSLAVLKHKKCKQKNAAKVKTFFCIFFKSHLMYEEISAPSCAVVWGREGQKCSNIKQIILPKMGSGFVKK